MDSWTAPEILFYEPQLYMTGNEGRCSRFCSWFLSLSGWEKLRGTNSSLLKESFFFLSACIKVSVSLFRHSISDVSVYKNTLTKQ
jgi:hypothetical protein